MPTKTIVFIHGLFMTYRCWDSWVSYFQAKGYTCLAVPYPGREKSVAELRQSNPDPGLARLGFDAVLDHFIQTIQGLPEAPLIIGHSLGGLVTQALLNRGLGAAGVTISSAPPQGLLSFKPSFFRSNFAVLNPLNPSSRPYMMPFAAFRYGFVNGLPESEQRAIYDTHVPPESLRIPRDVLFSKSARIDFARPHPPLLMIAGSNDHIIPASLVKANFERYKALSSPVEYKEFENRTHYAIGQSGWEQIADTIVEWIGKQHI